VAGTGVWSAPAMLAAFAGVVQERQGTTDNNDCSAQRDQCRLHLVASQNEAPDHPPQVNSAWNECWMNAGSAPNGSDPLMDRTRRSTVSSATTWTRLRSSIPRITRQRPTFGGRLDLNNLNHSSKFFKRWTARTTGIFQTRGCRRTRLLHRHAKGAETGAATWSNRAAGRIVEQPAAVTANGAEAVARGRTGTCVAASRIWRWQPGRLGSRARVDNSTKDQRRDWLRRAARTRWRKGRLWETCPPCSQSPSLCGRQSGRYPRRARAPSCRDRERSRRTAASVRRRRRRAALRLTSAFDPSRKWSAARRWSPCDISRLVALQYSRI